MAAKMMGIVAAGLILWVVFSTPHTTYAEEESSRQISPPLPPSKHIGLKEVSMDSGLGKKVCSPSSTQEPTSCEIPDLAP